MRGFDSIKSCYSAGLSCLSACLPVLILCIQVRGVQVLIITCEKKPWYLLHIAPDVACLGFKPWETRYAEGRYQFWIGWIEKISEWLAYVSD